MKKSRNYTWLILGIITILMGIIVPFVAFNQSMYYEVEKDTQAGNVTFYVTITSKDEIKDIKNAIVELEYDNADDKEYEVYYVQPGKTGDKFKYEFKVVESQDWVFVDKINSVKLRTIDGVVEIDEKNSIADRIPIVVFAVIIGGFMIFVNFFNNKSKNRTLELKEIIAASSKNEYNNIDYNYESDNDFVEEVKQVEETKVCEYCGTQSNKNETTCSSCGAKFKKRD